MEYNNNTETIGHKLNEPALLISIGYALAQITNSTYILLTDEEIYLSLGKSFVNFLHAGIFTMTEVAQEQLLNHYINTYCIETQGVADLRQTDGSFLKMQTGFELYHNNAPYATELELVYVFSRLSATNQKKTLLLQLNNKCSEILQQQHTTFLFAQKIQKYLKSQYINCRIIPHNKLLLSQIKLIRYIMQQLAAINSLIKKIKPKCTFISGAALLPPATNTIAVEIPKKIKLIAEIINLLITLGYVDRLFKNKYLSLYRACKAENEYILITEKLLSDIFIKQKYKLQEIQSYHTKDIEKIKSMYFSLLLEYMALIGEAGNINVSALEGKLLETIHLSVTMYDHCKFIHFKLEQLKELLFRIKFLNIATPSTMAIYTSLKEKISIYTSFMETVNKHEKLCVKLKQQLAMDVQMIPERVGAAKMLLILDNKMNLALDDMYKTTKSLLEVTKQLKEFHVTDSISLTDLLKKTIHKDLSGLSKLLEKDDELLAQIKDEIYRKKYALIKIDSLLKKASKNFYFIIKMAVYITAIPVNYIFLYYVQSMNATYKNIQTSIDNLIDDIMELLSRMNNFESLIVRKNIFLADTELVDDVRSSSPIFLS